MRRLKDFPIRWFVLALVLIISMGQAWAWWPIVAGGRVVVGDLITSTGAIVPRAATAVVNGRVMSNPWIQQATAGLTAIGVLAVLDQMGNTGETLPGNANLCPPDFSAPGWEDCNSPPDTADSLPTSPYYWYNTILNNAGLKYASHVDASQKTLELGYWSVNPGAWLNWSEGYCVSPMYGAIEVCTEHTVRAYKADGAYLINITVFRNSCPAGSYFDGTQCVTGILCPSGYAASGTTCNLTDNPKVMWPSDGKITMMPTPNGWVPHPRDPDAISQTVPTGQSFTNSGIDPNNAPITETWYVLPDGGMKFEQKVQTNTEQGTTQVTTQGFETNPQGTVTNTWYFNTENSSLNISNATTNTSTQTVEANIDLPNDYAREATLQEINEKLESPTLTTPGPAPGELYEKTDKTFDTVITGFKNRILAAPWVAGATSFFSTNVSGTCPTWTIPAVWVFPAIPIDMQCSAAMENVWPVIGAIVMLTAAFIAWRWAFL